MLLVYTIVTPRVRYIFKQLFDRILGIEVVFTDKIAQFVAHVGPKCSYGSQPLGHELFFQAYGLLSDRGIREDIDIRVTFEENMPYFFEVPNEKSALSFDVFSASFYLLSRYEEYVPHPKDAYGFPATESLAFKDGFLQLPVIDLWCSELKKVLIDKFPDLLFVDRVTTVKLFCEINEAYAFRKKGWFRSVEGYLGDLQKFQLKRILQRTKVLLKLERDPFQVYNYLINTARRTGADISFFFGLGNYSSHEKSTTYQSQTYQRLIKSIADYCTIGIRFSVDALENESIQKTERKRFESIAHREINRSFCQYAKLSLPITYRNLIEQEVGSDYSMGYLNHAGFRAGTSLPFFFYDLEYEIQTPLRIIPFCLSENQFESFKSATKAQEVTSKLISTVKNVNGQVVIHLTNDLFDKSSAKYKFWDQMYQYFVRLHLK